MKDQLPWNTAPDFHIEQKDSYFLLVRKHGYFKTLCGYVGVGKEHPLWGIEYNSNDYDNPVINLECHEGVTFSGFFNHIFNSSQIWWIGFDCNHSGDYNPVDPFGTDSSQYRDFDYVMGEVNNLLQQVKAHATPKL